MTDLLDNFFNEKGIKKNVPEFSVLQETNIQSINEKLIKPTFQTLADKLKTYSNCKADVFISKKDTNSIRENIELRFYRTMSLKFVYRFKYSMKDELIIVTGQYNKPDLYEEATNFIDTGFSKDITELVDTNIIDDITKVFIQHVEIK